jgi:hypothetical protein
MNAVRDIYPMNFGCYTQRSAGCCARPAIAERDENVSKKYHVSN